MHPRSRALAALAGVLAASFVIGACASGTGAGGASYVRDTNSRTALRVPQGWTTYDEAEVLGEVTAAPQGDQPDPIEWLVGVDGDPNPSVSHILNGSSLATDYPQGIAMVQNLSFMERDNASMQYLRNYLFPIDQLIQNGSDAKVVSYDDEVVDGGLRGLHMVISFREASLAAAREAAAAAAGGTGSTPTGSDTLQRALLGGGGAAILTPGFVEIDQRTLIDQSSHKLYMMILMCTSECYARNRGTIEDTVNSWTVIQ